MNFIHQFLHLTLLELEPGDCRYPYGGDSPGEPITFCGQPAVEGCPYCLKHKLLCWRAPELRKDRRAA